MSSDESELNQLRQQLDEVNKGLASLFESRFDLIEKVAQIKSKHSIDCVIPSRREQMLTSCLSNTNSLHREYIERVFNTLFDQCELYLEQQIKQ